VFEGAEAYFGGPGVAGVCIIRNIGQLNLPVGMKAVSFAQCAGLTGAVDKLMLPEGMQSVDFEDCKGLTGTLVTLPPPSIKTFNISGSGVKIDVAAIEWPANATALVHDGSTLVCRITDPDESKEGAETSDIRIACNADQVIGTSLLWKGTLRP
jgi:hypothetical protein